MVSAAAERGYVAEAAALRTQAVTMLTQVARAAVSPLGLRSSARPRRSRRAHHPQPTTLSLALALALAVPLAPAPAPALALALAPAPAPAPANAHVLEQDTPSAADKEPAVFLDGSLVRGTASPQP